MDDSPVVTTYLLAMHRALRDSGLTSAAARGEIRALKDAYEVYIADIRDIPAGELANIHQEVLVTCEDLCNRLETVNTFAQLGADASLRDLVQRGAAAFARLQGESNKRSLGISFDFD
ncbi:MAG: hypothetical protein AB7N24_01760 [Dehalococcoidia bacterium]